MRSAWDRGAVGKWTGMEMGPKASKRWDGDATATAAACRALCGQLPDGQIKELVIVIPLQSPSKWGNYRCSPSRFSPCQLQSKHSAANLQCRQNTLSESVCGMMNAWRARSPRVMQGAGNVRRDGQWGCEGESLLAICVWGRAAVRVDNKFDNHTILPTRHRSSQLDSDSLCMRCLTGWTTLAARPHVLLVAF